jgi:hypothetical protein
MTAATASAGKKEEKAEQKSGKKRKKIYILAGGGAFLALLTWWGLQPYAGTIQYGVCKTYVETTLYYPYTLRINSVETFDQSSRIFYTFTDAFGQNRTDLIECVYTANPDGTLTTNLEKIEINRRPVPPEKLEAFRQTVPAILAYPPDLTIKKLDDALEDLVIDVPTNIL